MASSALTSVSLAAMGTFFYFQRLWGEETATANLGWLPLLSLIVFFVAFSCGLSNVPFIIMGEMFPSEFRVLLGTISSSFNMLCTFVVVHCFPDLLLSLGKDGTFYLFTAFTLFSIIFVYFFLPETKGKTLEEMEKLFNPHVVTSGDNVSLEEKVISSIKLPSGRSNKPALLAFQNLNSGNTNTCPIPCVSKTLVNN